MSTDPEPKQAPAPAGVPERFLGLRRGLLAASRRFDYQTGARASVSASMSARMEPILPYTELTAFLLSVNFVGRVSPEVFLHPAVESEAANIDNFVKAIGKGGDDPASELCFTGITRHPAARLVSWQALPLLSTIGHRQQPRSTWCIRDSLVRSPQSRRFSS